MQKLLIGYHAVGQILSGYNNYLRKSGVQRDFHLIIDMLRKEHWSGNNSDNLMYLTDDYQM